MQSMLESISKEHLSLTSKALSEVDGLEGLLIRAGEMLAAAFESGHSCYIMGSGISSFLSEYASAIFLSYNLQVRPPLPLYCLNNSVYSSDINNVYVNQLTARVNEGDVVMGLALDRENVGVVEALKYALKYGSKTIGIVSNNLNIDGFCDLKLELKSLEACNNYEVCVVIFNTILKIVNNKMFGI